MQTYQSTPDYYREYIEHGYLKDTAAKVHKYIERWRGKNGKWYYRYKSKASSALTKVRRNMLGADAEDITTDNGRRVLQNTGRRNWSGRPNSMLDNKKGSRVNAGISAGRERVGKKKKEKMEMLAKAYMPTLEDIFRRHQYKKRR